MRWINILILKKKDSSSASSSSLMECHDHQHAGSTGSSDMDSQIRISNLTNHYKFKKGGLIKKTTSIMVNGVSR